MEHLASVFGFAEIQNACVIMRKGEGEADAAEEVPAPIPIPANSTKSTDNKYEGVTMMTPDEAEEVLKALKPIFSD